MAKHYTGPRSQASAELEAVAREVTHAYIKEARPVGVLLIGSAAAGTSDYYSDLDLALYYEELPSNANFAAAANSLGVKNAQPMAPRSDTGYLETFELHGVECQLSHITVNSFLDSIEAVLSRHEAGNVMQKVLEGLVSGIPLYGDDIIAPWQARARNFPPELGIAMVRHFLQVRPIWYVAERMTGRDATLFLEQMRADAVLNLLGILAGLNRVYFSTFQFKRMNTFASGLSITPDLLAERLDDILDEPPGDSAIAIEFLYREVLELVRVHAPDVDINSLVYPPGKRQTPWGVH